MTACRPSLRMPRSISSAAAAGSCGAIATIPARRSGNLAMTAASSSLLARANAVPVARIKDMCAR